MNRTVYQDKDKNAIRYSTIDRIDTEIDFKGFGVKYVASGQETYYINGRKFQVREGDYIIGNDFTKAAVHINQSQPVQGLCIDISAGIISEVASFHEVTEQDLSEFLLSEQFFVNRYNVKNTTLGYLLIEINDKIKKGNFVHSLHNEELFYSLAESVIMDQRFVFNQLSKLNFKKHETNQELLRALLKAKEVMDATLFDAIRLDDLALTSGISKYHFIRLFKSVFGISPYQYIKHRKLDLARMQLLKGSRVVDVAVQFGYPDTPSFSKAFKQLFGLNPSAINKQ
jgi:AraC family transcriptional regulator